MTTAKAGRPRGRPRKITQDQQDKLSIQEVDGEIEQLQAKDTAPPVVSRQPMRESLREEDPRARAAKRTAELRNHLGSMDTGTDDFYVDANSIPDGWTYEWKRKTVLGAEDPSYQVALAHAGWEPVPANRHPEMMPSSMTYSNIERKGMILMERPAEITAEVRQRDLINARKQVRVKEQQLSSAPDGTLTRDHAQAQPNIKKSYSPINIPKE